MKFNTAALVLATTVTAQTDVEYPQIDLKTTCEKINQLNVFNSLLNKPLLAWIASIE